jgi:phosphoenolpyruvate-protein phosphotransferase
MTVADSERVSTPPEAGNEVAGIAAAPGVAIGPAWLVRASVTPGSSSSVEHVQSGSPGERIRNAAETAAEQLRSLADRLRGEGSDAEAGIMDAQAMMATDPALLDAAIEEAGRSNASDPASVVETAAAGIADMLASIEDELLAARAADVRDVAARIARLLRGEAIELPAVPSIAVADDLPPSVTVDLPPGLLLGIALETGSRTSHAAILARARRIPAVVGAAGLLAVVRQATAGSAAAPDRVEGAGIAIAIDGDEGVVIVRPDQETATALTRRAEQRSAARKRAGPRLPGTTRDGHRVPLLANIGGPGEAAAAIESGAEGVGLLRSEFMFMGRSTAPGEEEQRAAYAEVLRAFGPERPVVIRLIDVGGDKGIPYLGLPPEANPFLGVRGLRLAYEVARPLVVTQLRAILRAAADTGAPAHIMAPMVATRSDVSLLCDLRDEALRSLADEGRRVPADIATGIMIEVPAAAFRAERLAPAVDFFSIGTNDLTQYMLAADRGNGRLGRLQDALEPGVLAAIAATVAGADGRGIPVAVCGELASDPAGALVLVGLGVDELSMDASALDEVRDRLAASTTEELRAVAAEALALDSAAEVRAMVGRRLG